MTKELIRYPNELERYNIGVVRRFDDQVLQVEQDLIDTMKHNDLDALSAVQIGYSWQVIAVKDGERYRILVNPRIIRHESKIDTTEKTDYFPDITFHLKRFGMISLVYEDTKGESQTWIINDSQMAIVMQRKIDYMFGSTPLDRLDKNQREKALSAIAGDLEGDIYDPGEVCPAFSKREYFISIANKLLFLMGISIFTPLFGWSQKTINNIFLFDAIALPLVILVMIGYYLYAQHEAKVYTQCTSCQTASQIGVAGKRMIVALGIFVLDFIILRLMV